MESEVEDLLDSNRNARGGRGEIVLPNGPLAVIWIHELYGQFSDGAWENHWFDHPDSYEDYHGLTVTVDESRDTPVIRNSNIEGELVDFLDFNPSTKDDLVDIIGDRMVGYVQDHGYPLYNESALRKDLRLLNETEVR